MTKMQKFKSWTKENAENIVVGTVFTVFGAGFIALSVAAIKDENTRLAAERAAWEEVVAHEAEIDKTIVEEHNAGNFVYALMDGSYLAVPPGANQKLIQ